MRRRCSGREGEAEVASEGKKQRQRGRGRARRGSNIKHKLTNCRKSQCSLQVVRQMAGGTLQVAPFCCLLPLPLGLPLALPLSALLRFGSMTFCVRIRFENTFVSSGLGSKGPTGLGWSGLGWWHVASMVWCVCNRVY